MLSSPIATLLATESTRRALTEPARVAEVRRPRRAVARSTNRGIDGSRIGRAWRFRVE